MLALAAICVLVNVAILNSPLGYYLRTIRDNEKAAQAIGVNILRYKITAMVISAMLASVVGTAYVRYLTFADPYLLISPVITIEIVLFATVGGLGRAYGPALGAIAAGATWRNPARQARQHAARPALFHLRHCGDLGHSGHAARAVAAV